ncbi:MAG: prepilin peptidase [Phenylobacterium sp.]|uniref:A24 family peptidase n=1 Tax=Phenylobacterium sp. TaxID=1871053 RepID=UPI0039189129
MSPGLLHGIWAAGFAVLLLLAAATDVARRRIYNWTVLALAALYAAAALLGVAPSDWVSGLSAGLIALAVGYVLFHFGIMGGGDAKLLAAVALYFGVDRLPFLAAAVALIGGAVAVGYLVFLPKRVMRGLTRSGRTAGPGVGIPYGVAISAGALLTGAFTTGFFPPPIG